MTKRQHLGLQLIIWVVATLLMSFIARRALSAQVPVTQPSRLPGTPSVWLGDRPPRVFPRGMQSRDHIEVKRKVQHAQEKATKTQGKAQ